MAASPGPLPLLLPDSARLRVESVQHTEGTIVIAACAIALTATCPLCSSDSGRVHSQYGRTLIDLPCQGARVRIHLWTRRFYCRRRDCRRKIFSERFPHLTVPYGRQTDRQRKVLKRIGYALGGEAGFRLASQLAIDGSADTILRVLKREIRLLSDDPIKALGVDDWAWRKGQRYGTILVDLARHQPVDLLPDRESETLEKWLEAHPGVEIISRDRAGAYAEGARKGAPEAVQVADRFHILCNLTQALQRLLERLPVALRKIQPEATSVEETPPMPDATAAPDDAATVKPASAPVRANRHQRERQQRRERRKTRYEAVREAFQRGLTQRAIARELRLSRKTVRRFLRAEQFPEQAPRPRRTGLEPFREYLEKRWAEGCHNAARLWRELREQGYTGQSSRVKGFLQAWRSQGPKAAPSRRKLPSLRLVAFWLAKRAEKRKEVEQEWVQAVTKSHPHIATAEALAQAFREMMQNRKADDLDRWLESAETAGIQELNGFASGIRRDHDAVVAGIEKSWSNGQVEGQVHRLKLLKRQMYGRSGFLLLRMRVLPFYSGPAEHHTRSP